MPIRVHRIVGRAMYVYEEIKPSIFSEDGQVMFIAIRDHVSRCLKMSGAVRMGEAISVSSGDSWQMLACVDRLVELGELREITNRGECAGQHRVFVRADNSRFVGC